MRIWLGVVAVAGAAAIGLAPALAIGLAERDSHHHQSAASQAPMECRRLVDYRCGPTQRDPQPCVKPLSPMQDCGWYRNLPPGPGQMLRCMRMFGGGPMRGYVAPGRCLMRHRWLDRGPWRGHVPSPTIPPPALPQTPPPTPSHSS